MKLKLENVRRKEPRTKTLAIPTGQSLHERYYRCLHAADAKHIKMHEYANQVLEDLVSQFEEMLELRKSS